MRLLLSVISAVSLLMLLLLLYSGDATTIDTTPTTAASTVTVLLEQQQQQQQHQQQQHQQEEAHSSIQGDDAAIAAELRAYDEYRWVFTMGECSQLELEHDANRGPSTLPALVERVEDNVWVVSASYRPDRHTIEVLGVANLTIAQRHWCAFERTVGRSRSLELVEGLRLPRHVLEVDIPNKPIVIVCELPWPWREALDSCSSHDRRDSADRALPVSMAVVKRARDRHEHRQALSVPLALSAPLVREEERAERVHACLLVHSTHDKGVSLVSLLAEWIAYYTRVLDVAHVVVYASFDPDDGRNADAMWMFERLRVGSGRVSVVDWRAVAHGTPARYHAQLVQLNHCRMANRPYARYLLTPDLDEFLMLNCSRESSNRTCTASHWVHANNLDERSAGACFPSYRFHILPHSNVSWSVRNLPHVAPSELWTQRLSEREEFVEHRLEANKVRNSLRFKGRRKCLLHTERTEWSNVHDLIPHGDHGGGGWRVWEDVSEHEGALWHYRRLPRAPLVPDHRMHRFSSVILDGLSALILHDEKSK